MNTKLSLAIFAATAALSTNVFAGELYAGADSSLNVTSPAAMAQAPAQMISSIATDGEIYTAVNVALNEAEGSAAPMPATITTLAVGGELGAPAGTTLYDGSIGVDSALAE